MLGLSPLTPLEQATKETSDAYERHAKRLGIASGGQRKEQIELHRKYLLNPDPAKEDQFELHRQCLAWLLELNVLELLDPNTLQASIPSFVQGTQATWNALRARERARIERCKNLDQKPPAELEALRLALQAEQTELIKAVFNGRALDSDKLAAPGEPSTLLRAAQGIYVLGQKVQQALTKQLATEQAHVRTAAVLPPGLPAAAVDADLHALRLFREAIGAARVANTQELERGQGSSTAQLRDKTELCRRVDDLIELSDLLEKMTNAYELHCQGKTVEAEGKAVEAMNGLIDMLAQCRAATEQYQGDPLRQAGIRQTREIAGLLDAYFNACLNVNFDTALVQKIRSLTKSPNQADRDARDRNPQTPQRPGPSIAVVGARPRPVPPQAAAGAASPAQADALRQAVAELHQMLSQNAPDPNVIASRDPAKQEAAYGALKEHLRTLIGSHTVSLVAVLEATNDRGRNAFHLAARNDLTGNATRLMLANLKTRLSSEALAAIMNRESTNGETPLMVAANHGNANTVRALLEAGATAGATRALAALQSGAVAFSDRAIAPLLEQHVAARAAGAAQQHAQGGERVRRAAAHAAAAYVAPPSPTTSSSSGDKRRHRETRGGDPRAEKAPRTDKARDAGARGL